MKPVRAFLCNNATLLSNLLLVTDESGRLRRIEMGGIMMTTAGEVETKESSFV